MKFYNQNYANFRPGLLLLLFSLISSDFYRGSVSGWRIYKVRVPPNSVISSTSRCPYQQQLLATRHNLSMRRAATATNWLENVIESFFKPILGLIETNPSNNYNDATLKRRRAVLPPTNLYDQFRIPYKTRRNDLTFSLQTTTTTTTSPPSERTWLEQLPQMPFYIRHAPSSVEALSRSPVATFVGNTIETILSASQQQQLAQHNTNQHFTCTPKRYRYTLRCPQKNGFFQLGQSCYYISSIRSQ